MSEILRNAPCFRQPQPHKNPGGDCFACALKNAVDCLFPGRPVPFEVAWEAWRRETAGGGTTISNVWPNVEKAAYKLRDHDYELEIRADLSIVEPRIEWWSHPWGLSVDGEAWAYRLEAWLAAGWMAIAEMNYAGAGPVNVDGTKNTTDHFVVLDGQRHVWQEMEKFRGSYSLEHETHVVCSAKGGYWINTTKLIERHGVAGIFLLRESKVERRKC